MLRVRVVAVAAGILLGTGLLVSCDGRRGHHRRHHRGGHGQNDPHHARMHGTQPRRHGGRPQHGRRHRRGRRRDVEPTPVGDTPSDAGETDLEAPSPDADTGEGKTPADTGTATAGRRVYRRYCSNCHGPDRRGSPPTYPSLRGLSERMSRERARRIIRTGRRAMPPFSHLSDTQQVNLLDHLYTAPHG